MLHMTLESQQPIPTVSRLIETQTHKDFLQTKFITSDTCDFYKYAAPLSVKRG